MASLTRFPPRFLDQLRERVPASQVIGAYVRLKPKARGEFTGLCPFHNEKTPSFTVSDQKGFYHCFGCGAHGDIIRFLTDHTGLAFPEAVKELAAKAGIPLPAPDPRAEEQYRKETQLTDVMELAAHWYQQQLNTLEGRIAADYIQQRALSRESVQTFRLGYAPNRRDALKSAMLARNVTERQLLDLGLLIQPEQGESYDRFRSRLMFPIRDAKGKIIAFGGRILGDGQPKYLNSPETELFHKGHVLYNLDLARQPAYKAGRILVVEGYMDAIALHQHGFTEVVAPLGTAMTEHHLHTLWQVCDQPLLCLDGDNAGKRAMERAAELALPHLQPGKSLGFILLPQGQDPDDYLKSRSGKEMESLLRKPVPLHQALWDMAQLRHPGDTPEQRAAFERELFALTATVKENTVRRYYEDAFRNKIYAWKRTGFSKEKGAQSAVLHKTGLTAPDSNPYRTSERQLMLLALHYPSLLKDHTIEDAFMHLAFMDPVLSQLRVAILNYMETNEVYETEKLFDHLENEGWKNHIEQLGKVSYESAFILENASEAVVKAGWNYWHSCHHYEQLKQEFDNLIARQHNDDSFESLHALERHLRDVSKENARYKHELETLLEDEFTL